MARPEAVVKQALLDAREGKRTVCVRDGDEGSRGGNKAASAQCDSKSDEKILVRKGTKK